ncbi:hypothetical protein M513_09599 [Trichuris suis]|uniref:Beta-1,4-N-acetylgalactosaminyltransferase n=1 Tax=Trichuris suis TaxID=68888 RepID=A0A085LWZ2_9BILA|nr:hypothetical protein M513_09599 [Trichuris suis]
MKVWKLLLRRRKLVREYETICALCAIGILLVIVYLIIADAYVSFRQMEFYEDRISQEMTVNSMCRLPSKKRNEVFAPNMSVLRFSTLNRLFPHVRDGLRIHNCSFAERVAIIVPCTNRRKHLHTLLLNLHSFLYDQPISYGIFVVDQISQTKIEQFNKGISLNGAFIHVMQIPMNWTCIMFHDIDLLPENTIMTYDCHKSPRHLSTSLDTYDSNPQNEWLGGVTAITPEQFIELNGYSNSFWGWGGEDVDIHLRAVYSRMKVQWEHQIVYRYTALRHRRITKPNPCRIKLVNRAFDRSSTDGLNSLEITSIKSRRHQLYNEILISVNEKELRKAVDPLCKYTYPWLLELAFEQLKSLRQKFLMYCYLWWSH